MEDLRDAITTALRTTWAELVNTRERFYGLSLFTGPCFEYVYATAFSEEGLDAIAGSDPALRRELRWSPADSPHHLAGEEHFDDVARILESRADIHALSESAFAAEMDARSEACFGALSTLDREGIFGEARAHIVLNVMQGDQSDRSRLTNASALNPGSLLRQFAGDLEIREPSGEHRTLGASAYQINALDLRASVLAASGSGGELFAWRGDTELHSSHTRAARWALALADDRLYVSDGNDVVAYEIGRDALGKPRRFACAKDQVRALAVSPDGALVVASSWAGDVVAWSASAEKEWELGLDGHALSFSASGTLAIGGASGVTFVSAEGERVGKLPRTRDIWALAWSRDGTQIASATPTSIQCWREANGAWKRGQKLPSGKAGRVNALAFSPKGTLLASAHDGGGVYVWDVARGGALVRRGRQEAMLDVVWLDDHSIACAGRDVDRGPPVYVFPV